VPLSLELNIAVVIVFVVPVVDSAEIIGGVTSPPPPHPVDNVVNEAL
jgi:hypothetical protein